MRPRHAVLLNPPVFLRPSQLPSHKLGHRSNFRSPYTLPSSVSSKSFACHTSENSPVSPAIATDPKTPLCKSFACHTSETPLGGCYSQQFSLSSAHPLFLQALAHSFAFAKSSTCLFSSDSALSFATAASQALYFLCLAHSFHHHGGGVFPPLFFPPLAGARESAGASLFRSFPFNFQLSIEDPDLVGTVNLFLLFLAALPTGHGSRRTNYHSRVTFFYTSLPRCLVISLLHSSQKRPRPSRSDGGSCEKGVPSSGEKIVSSVLRSPETTTVLRSLRTSTVLRSPKTTSSNQLSGGGGGGGASGPPLNV
jgi:hypothetical protein